MLKFLRDTLIHIHYNDVNVKISLNYIHEKLQKTFYFDGYYV